MSSSNYRRNEAAIRKFRKELMDMVDDIREIDKRVLNQAVNEGVAYAKRRTPVGAHPNPVVFTIRNGPKVGEVVSFKVSSPGVGGKLRESWHKLPTRRTAGTLETEMVNNMEYASYWNYGHRIVTKKDGPTKGFVKGTHVLEKTQNYVSKRMIALFKRKWRRCRIDTINELYKAVAEGLKDVKKCKVYREDVPQNFTVPCFMVTLYDQNPSRGINGRLKNTVNLDVLYFPENRNQAEQQEECWSVGQELAREFAAPGFKIKNRNLKIEDKVLHFMFDVDYREYLEDSTPQMQSIIQNTDVKED